MSALSADPPPYFDSDDCRCLHDDTDHGWRGCLRRGCRCVARWRT